MLPLCLYSYQAEFIQPLLSTGKKRLASRFILTYRYINDVLSINNQKFENYLGHLYPVELEMKATTESITSLLKVLPIFTTIDWERWSTSHIPLLRQTRWFQFPHHFPLLSSNIQSSLAYCVLISQHIRYARAYSSSECFILRAKQLSSKLL